MDPEWRLTSENGCYIYPDLETAYNGVFRGGVMVAGRAAILEADSIREGILRVKVRRILLLCSDQILNFNFVPRLDFTSF